MINEDKILDVDTKQRFQEEWAQIYHVRLAKDAIIQNKAIDEFEWVCLLLNSNYYKLPAKHNSYEIADEMEMRAQKIYRDIYASADRSEKKLLQENVFVATDYVLNYRLKNS